VSTWGFELPIAAWSAWAPGLESSAAWLAWANGEAPLATDGSPSLPFLDPLLRRRLGRVSRMALQAAHDCMHSRDRIARTVFASRHGELHRTVRMLYELSRNHQPSPTDFSLSVHNAAAGINSIIRQDRSPSTAIAAGDESFVYGVLEAAAQWQANRNRPVLMVFAEEPTPSEYQSFIEGSEHPHALALLLRDDAKSTLRLRRAATRTPLSAEMQSLSFLRALLRNADGASWAGERSAWEWSVVPHAA
jgi:hypothetical protein